MGRRLNEAVALDFLRSFAGHDPVKPLSMLSADVVYIDSTAEQVEGRDACEDILRRYFALDMQFSADVEVVASAGDTVLIKGRISSHVPQLNANCHWRIKVRDGKITEYQSFRDSFPPAIIRMLERESPLPRRQPTSGFEGRLAL